MLLDALYAVNLRFAAFCCWLMLALIVPHLPVIAGQSPIVIWQHYAYQSHRC
jgi:hypothetical protein